MLRQLVKKTYYSTKFNFRTTFETEARAFLFNRLGAFDCDLNSFEAQNSIIG
jgi:hypothetical protein